MGNFLGTLVVALVAIVGCAVWATAYPHGIPARGIPSAPVSCQASGR